MAGHDHGQQVGVAGGEARMGRDRNLFLAFVRRRQYPKGSAADRRGQLGQRPRIGRQRVGGKFQVPDIAHVARP